MNGKEEQVAFIDLPHIKKELYQQPHARTPAACSEEGEEGQGQGGGAWGEIRNMKHQQGTAATNRAFVVFEFFLLSVTLLGLWVIPEEEEYARIFRVFYFPLIPLISMLWLWGVNVGVWTQFRMNYLKVFEVEDRVVLPCHEDVFKMAHVVTVIVLGSSTLFLLCVSLDFHILALKQGEFLYFALILLVLFPGDLIFGRQRRFLVTTLCKVVIPLWEVSFADFLLADVLTSLARPIADFAVVGCRLSSSYTRLGIKGTSEACNAHSWLYSFALAMPYLWRLIQCVKIYFSKGEKAQLANAAKYFTAFPVIYLSAVKFHTSKELWLGYYKPLWILSAVLNSGFSFYWDIARDWEFNLFSFRSSETILRKDLVYANQEKKYTWAIISNLLLRISWTCKLSAQLRHMYGLSLVLSLLEVFRRFQWMFIRIEVALLKDLKKAYSSIPQ